MDSFRFCVSDYDDVVPLELDQSAGEDELCRIMYSEEYKQLMGIARELMRLEELSVRALNLTSRLIEVAPAFYTAWNYRYRIVEHLVEENGSVAEEVFLLNKELDWLDEITLGNPKNYQIWSYRQSVISELHPQPILSRELPILQLMIDDDTKNYHVWSYRKWCCEHFNDYSNELVFTREFINRDVYNNSAWNHRLFVWKMNNEEHKPVAHELDFIKDKIRYVPQNISTWTYLRGYLELYNGIYDDETMLQDILAFTKSHITESSYALEFYAYLNSLKQVNNKQASIDAYRQLAETFDPIRKNLWDHKINLLEAM